MLESSFSHISGVVVLLRDRASGKIRGGLPLHLVRSSLRKPRLVSIPFATYSGVLADNSEDLERLVNAARELGTRLKAERVELRCLRNELNGFGQAEENSEVYLHHYIKLDRPVDTLWDELSRTAIRRPINKAEKLGIKVSEATSLDELQHFHNLLVAARKRLGLPATPFAFLSALWQQLPAGRRSLVVARQGEAIVGGVFNTMGGGLFTLEYYAETPEMRGTGVNQLVYWSALQGAHAKGFARFSFGRTAKSNEGLTIFKRHWGVVEEEITELQFPKPAKGSRFGALRTHLHFDDLSRAFLRRSPWPIYREMSAAFYRHRG